MEVSNTTCRQFILHFGFPKTKYRRVKENRRTTESESCLLVGLLIYLFLPQINVNKNYFFFQPQVAANEFKDHLLPSLVFGKTQPNRNNDTRIILIRLLLPPSGLLL